MKNSVITLITGFALSATLFAGMSQAAEPSNAVYGASAPEQEAGRTITIGPATRWANVANGETITFVTGEQRFTFHFQAYSGTQSVNLRAIAPAGADVPDIQVYISTPASDA